MEVLRADSYRRAPWRNGGGETAEIAAGPEGAGPDGFDWRVSMASVEADGPFSAFPGVDRTLAILDGDGLRLAVGDAPEVDLVAGAEPFRFPGDVPTTARLIGGPVTVLNAMTRLGAAAHSVRRLAVLDEEDLPDAAGLLFCRVGAIRVRGPDGEAELGPLDAVRLEPRGTWTVSAGLPSGAILVGIADRP